MMMTARPGSLAALRWGGGQAFQQVFGRVWEKFELPGRRGWLVVRSVRHWQGRQIVAAIARLCLRLWVRFCFRVTVVEPFLDAVSVVCVLRLWQAGDEHALAEDVVAVVIVEDRDAAVFAVIAALADDFSLSDSVECFCEERVGSAQRRQV